MEHTQQKRKKIFIQSPEPIVIDARGKKLGRLASLVAHLLMGKQIPAFRRHIMTNVKVTVHGTDELDISPRALSQKYHVRYSGFPGGLRKENIKQVIARKGYRELVKHAVYGMLPANKLRRLRMKNLVIKE